VAGANMTVARYSIGITLNPAAPGSSPTPSPAPKK